MPESVLTQKDLDALRALDACMVSNAIELFNVRLRNTGYTDASVRCMFDDFPPMVGYAATARVRSEEPPIDRRALHDRSDWWQSILEVPAPRIVVLEDMDKPPGRGAFVGDVHAAILRALGCIGLVTDGAVRELPRVREIGLHLFAGNVAVSHSYAHIFHFGAAVTIGGLKIRQGDLLHGDRHGVLQVPHQIASQIPNTAMTLRQNEDQLISSCSKGEMSLDELRQIVRKLK